MCQGPGCTFFQRHQVIVQALAYLPHAANLAPQVGGTCFGDRNQEMHPADSFSLDTAGECFSADMTVVCRIRSWLIFSISLALE